MCSLERVAKAVDGIGPTNHRVAIRNKSLKAGQVKFLGFLVRGVGHCLLMISIALHLVGYGIGDELQEAAFCLVFPVSECYPHRGQELSKVKI